jgi:type IV secretion system protein VirB10
MLGLDAPPPSPVHATTSPVGRRPWSRWKKLGYLLLSGISLVGIGWLTAQPDIPPEDRSQRLTPADRVGEVGNPFVPIPRDPPPVMPPATPVAATPPGLPVLSANRAWTMPSMTPPVPARPVPITGFQAQASGAAPIAKQGGTRTTVAAAGDDALSDRLNAGDDPETAVATLLPDRNLFLTMGTPMPCITEQPIRTDVPGPFRCKVPTPVFSTSGAVPLLDPGTWIVGRVSDPLQRGMERAFAVVTRLETPQGCLVKLRAPVGDQLGTSGIDGEVNTHFWERFRGFAMIALLDAAGQAAALGAARAIGGGSDGNQLNFYQFQGAGQQLGQGSFGDDVNIPNTLSTRQARNLVVVAMQDIDMRRCFTLRTVR